METQNQAGLLRCYREGEEMEAERPGFKSSMGMGQGQSKAAAGSPLSTGEAHSAKSP